MVYEVKKGKSTDAIANLPQYFATLGSLQNTPIFSINIRTARSSFMLCMARINIGRKILYKQGYLPVPTASLVWYKKPGTQKVESSSTDFATCH